jgi:MFS family permease
VVALLPIFAGDILKVGASGLGILSASDSVGALIGGLLLIRFPVGKRSGRILLSAVAGFGFCMIGFGLSKTFWVSVLLLALGGAFDSVSRVVRGAIVQLSAPAEMRGRVGAVNSIFIGVSNQLGEFESGVTAKLFGTTPSVILGGVLTLIVVTGTAFSAPRLRELDVQKL